MRLLAGIIIGIILTVGAAYYHDINVPGGSVDTNPPAPESQSRQIVNWGVLGAVTREEMAFAQNLWDKTFKR